MAEQSSDRSNNFALLSALWREHQEADWPVSGEVNEGQLMTLDTVVAGCVTYYFEEQSLDEKRLVILDDCLADLENLVSDLDPDSGAHFEYFERLQQLGKLLLDMNRPE